jgi:hydrogenase maturation protease
MKIPGSHPGEAKHESRGAWFPARADLAADDLTAGWRAQQASGTYQLERGGGDRCFDDDGGPTSWKRSTYPPRVPIRVGRKGDDGAVSFDWAEPDIPKLAFLGVRACELATLGIRDRVPGPRWAEASRRPEPLIRDSAAPGAMAQGARGGASAGRLPLLVCGEPARGDDAVAFAAVAALPAIALDRVEVVPCGQLEVDHLLDVPAGMPCIVVDAAVGVAPGEIVVLSLADVGARRDRGAPRSSHTLRPDQAIALAATLRGAPPAGVFVGIGGVDFTLGADLSPVVRAGLPRLVERLAAEIERLAPASGPASPGRVGRPVPP